MLRIYGWQGRSSQGLIWLHRNMHKQFMGFADLPFQEFCKMLNNAACENRTKHQHSWHLEYISSPLSVVPKTTMEEKPE